MPYHITIEYVHGSILLAENIATRAEARNAVKILFCIPGCAIATATVWDTNTGAKQVWKALDSGELIRLDYPIDTRRNHE